VLLVALFAMLGIREVDEVITSINFTYPASTVAFGLGLALYAAKEDVLFEFARAILNVLGWLLPLLSLVVISFVLVLPIQGVTALWDTGYASSMMLSLMALNVFIINCAFQNGQASKYPAWLLKLSNLAAMTLPIYAMLTMYALYLRVHQYGWTADRVWLASAIFVASIYAFGYAWAGFKSFKLAQGCMSQIKRINVFAAMMLVLTLSLLNSPILDPARIMVNSQLTRLNISHQKDIDTLKLFRFEGGRYGNDALLKIAKDGSNQTLKEAAKIALKSSSRYMFEESLVKKKELSLESLKKDLKIYPINSKVDEAFYEALFADIKAQKLLLDFYYSSHEDSSASINLLVMDFNHDHQAEVLVYADVNAGSKPSLYTKQSGRWEMVGHLESLNHVYNSPRVSDSLKDQDYQLVTPEWQMIKIGKTIYGKVN
jgi:hypothetical protein